MKPATWFPNPDLCEMDEEDGGRGVARRSRSVGGIDGSGDARNARERAREEIMRER